MLPSPARRRQLPRAAASAGLAAAGVTAAGGGAAFLQQPVNESAQRLLSARNIRGPAVVFLASSASFKLVDLPLREFCRRFQDSGAAESIRRSHSFADSYSPWAPARRDGSVPTSDRVAAVRASMTRSFVKGTML